MCVVVEISRCYHTRTSYVAQSNLNNGGQASSDLGLGLNLGMNGFIIFQRHSVRHVTAQHPDEIYHRVGIFKFVGGTSCSSLLNFLSLISYLHRYASVLQAVNSTVKIGLQGCLA